MKDKPVRYKIFNFSKSGYCEYCENYDIYLRSDSEWNECSFKEFQKISQLIQTLSNCSNNYVVVREIDKIDVQELFKEAETVVEKEEEIKKKREEKCRKQTETRQKNLLKRKQKQLAKLKKELEE